jgi:FAD/FMN-containing dehydrogenase
MTHEVSRQAFLRGASTVAAGVLLGGCRTPAPPGSPAPGSTAPPAPRDWRTLADAIDGRVILPSNNDFSRAKALFNSRFDDSAPAAVITAMSQDDVRRAVTFAAHNGLKIAARAGGHSYIGDSAPRDAMVIDLRQLRAGIRYDEASQRVTIPAAATLESVQRALDAHGRSIPTGSCPTVGVAGLTLGGGLGADTRRCGLTCDALVSATVVLPSGDTVTAMAADHGDLFWALRGGGGGHFGVATSFTFGTFGVADRDVVTLVFTEDVASQALLGFAEWISAAENTDWGMVNLTASADGLRCTVVAATPAGNGPSAAADLIAAVCTQPLDETTRTLDHMAFVDYFSGGPAATTPRVVVAGSDIIGEMTSAAADSIASAITAAPSALGSASVVIESLTGAARDVDPTGSAFPWRRQAACLQWYTEPQAGSPRSVEAATGWIAVAHRTLGTHSVGGYVNYIEPDMPTGRYFATNLNRLAVVRKKYDPDNVMYSTVRY